MKVTNQRNDREVAVRGGMPEQRVYRIKPKETVFVDGFNPKKSFNQALIDEGSIVVSGGGKQKESSQDRGEALKADLDEKQTAYKQAKDAAEAAQTAVKDEPTDANKKAFASAKEALKKAGDAVDKAQAAFDKG